MTFKKGHDPNRSGGRPKGALSKRTEDARALAERLGFNPLELLAHFAMNNWQALGYETATKTVVTKEGVFQVDRIDEALRQKSAKDAVPFIYPQLKSVELAGKDGESAFKTFADIVSALVEQNGKDKNREQKDPADGSS